MGTAQGSTTRRSLRGVTRALTASAGGRRDRKGPAVFASIAFVLLAPHIAAVRMGLNERARFTSLHHPLASSIIAAREIKEPGLWSKKGTMRYLELGEQPQLPAFAAYYSLRLFRT